MYHNIATAPKGLRVYRSLYVSRSAFVRQMRLLALLGYRGMSMSAAMPYLRGERAGRVAVITLDDGYVDNLSSALPVLQRNGFTATCYAVSGCLGRYNAWDEQRLGVRKSIMSAEQLRAWQAAGMEVGVHTRTHARLSQCNDRQLHDEVAGSKADLENWLGTGISQFCYPYGDLDDRVVDAVRLAGFQAATTTRRGRASAGPAVDFWRLPRIQIARHHTLPQLAAKVLSSYEDRRA